MGKAEVKDLRVMLTMNSSLGSFDILYDADVNVEMKLILRWVVSWK